jgi:hypothetical protein
MSLDNVFEALSSTVRRDDSLRIHSWKAHGQAEMDVGDADERLGALGGASK